MIIESIKRHKYFKKKKRSGRQLGGKFEGRRIEQKGKKTHGHGKQCGDCGEHGSIRGLNGNGKKIQ